MSGSFAQPECGFEAARTRSLIIQVDESAVGVGKTERALRRALQFPARWLFAVERRDSIAELAGRVATLADANSRVKVVKISSDESGRGFSVRQEVEALPDRYQEGHIVAICTHEALLMSNLDKFVDWHLIIDEVPSVLLMQDLQSKLDLSFFRTNYALTVVNKQWSKVTLTDAGRVVTGSDLFQDDSHRHLRLFHQRVTRSTDGNRAVLCNLRCWEDMERGDVKWIWWSLFSVQELAPFASVFCLGNNFMASIATKMMQVWEPEVIWKTAKSDGERQLVSRRVSVRYFSEKRKASRGLFEHEKGRAALIAIADHIADEVPPDRFIWSCNSFSETVLKQHLPNSAYLKPKQAGTSKWMHCSR